MNKCFVSYLTIRKHAPSRTAFILTSRSMGKLMPKLSASVSVSLMKPVHCLLMRPTECPSLLVICTRGQKNAHKLLYFILVCVNIHIVFSKVIAHSDTVCLNISKPIAVTHTWQTDTITDKYIRQNPHPHSSWWHTKALRWTAPLFWTCHR